MNEEKAIVVLITAGSREEAERLAEVLVERRLAACVQILPEIRSFYRWQGRTENAEEILILAKTVSANFAELEQMVRENHSYEVPEILAVPVADVSAAYFKWMLENTK